MPRFTPFRTVRRARHLKSLWQQRHDLIPMLRDAHRGEYRISGWTKLAFVACLVYVLSPIDLIPDFLPILGWGDDAAILFFLTRRIAAEIQRYREQKGRALKLVRF